MVTKDSAAKRNRQNGKRNLRNRMAKSTVHTAKRSFIAAVKAEDSEKAATEFVILSKLIDTAAGKKIFHKNTAARKKSRFHKMLNKMSVE